MGVIQFKLSPPPNEIYQKNTFICIDLTRDGQESLHQEQIVTASIRRLLWFGRSPCQFSSRFSLVEVAPNLSLCKHNYWGC